MPRPEVPYVVNGKRRYHAIFDPILESVVRHELHKLRAPPPGTDPVVCYHCQAVIDRFGKEAALERWGITNPVDPGRAHLVEGPNRPPKVPELYTPPLSPEDADEDREEDLDEVALAAGTATRFTNALRWFVGLADIALGDLEVPPDVQVDVKNEMFRLASRSGTGQLRWVQAQAEFHEFLNGLDRRKFKRLRQRPKALWYQITPDWVGQGIRNAVAEAQRYFDGLARDMKSPENQGAVDVSAEVPTQAATILRAFAAENGVTFSEAILFLLALWTLSR